MMRNATRKKGFSLAEVVIALSIILIVSLAAMSIALSSVSVTAKAVELSKAQGFAENALECFKAAENEAELRELIEFAEGVELTDDGDSVYLHTLGDGRFTAQIKVGFPENAEKTFELILLDKDGNEHLSLSYHKEVVG